MRPGVHVSDACPEDLDMLVELCLAARNEATVGAQLCTDDADRLRDQLGALLAVPGGLALTGTVDGAPAGMLLARLVGPSLFTEAVSLNLEAVYVVPDSRRRGLGHMLLSAAAQRAEDAGATDVYATPLPGTRGMQRFLARLGFAPAAAHRVVTTSALQRRLAHEGASTAAARRSSPRGLEDLIARRRQAREGRAATVVADQAAASISMQVNRAVQIRRPSASSTTTW